MEKTRQTWLIAAVLLWCAGAAHAAITISPAVLPNWTVNLPYSQPLTATGCPIPCVWSASGQLPQGLSLNVVSGTISGIPVATGRFRFTVTATALAETGTQTYTVVINQAPAITTSSLPGGQTGTVFSQTIAVANGTTPYQFFVSSGSLPSGLALDSTTGTIAGTPSQSGSFAFTILVTDQASASVSHAYTLSISPGQTSSLTITTTSPLPGGSPGTSYSYVLAASGGSPPYSWAVISGALPAGLSLNATSGAISGTPATAGSFTFTVQVTDTLHASAIQSDSIAISAGPSLPSMSLTGVPASASSAQQIPFDVSLSSAYSKDIAGTITLTFAPDAAASKDDPTIQFSSGGRTAVFTIPAGGTHAVFSVSAIAFQTGTVAGTISLAVSSNLSGGSPSRSLVVARSTPVVQSASVVKGASGFQVQIAGYSNTRELAAANFHFTAASGQSVQTADLPVSLSGPAGQWFAAATSASFGGQVLIVVPFTVQQGSQSGLTSVTVSLQNALGNSPAITANF